MRECARSELNRYFFSHSERSPATELVILVIARDFGLYAGVPWRTRLSVKQRCLAKEPYPLTVALLPSGTC